MREGQASDVESGLMQEIEAVRQPELDLPVIRTAVAILVADGINQRLIEAASIHLELSPVILREQDLDLNGRNDYELIIADEGLARTIKAAMKAREEYAEGVHPGLIAVRSRFAEETTTAALGLDVPGPDGVAQSASALNASELDVSVQEFDGVLLLPQEPAPLAAQLGLILYAYRAYARRYQTALDELTLNRSIFRSVTSGISVANAREPDMPLVYVNPAFEVMTGYSLEEVRGRNCRFLQNNERSQPGRTLIREALEEQREVRVLMKNFRKDGTSFWNELALSPIRNRAGEVTHVVGIQMDVTARVEFEAALRESEKLAAVGRLAASIAHEINNPLESVMNLLYLSRETGKREESLEYLAQADKELQRVAQITSQSLRFYKQSTKPRAVRCTELVESVLDLYIGRLESAHIRLEVRERMSASIVCLESEIRQVLSNLVRNAIDAMHGNGGRLLVRSREATEWRSGTPGVIITVADTGSGISRETMNKLYTAFFTTKGIGGTGLGLWVSSEIVKRHQGGLRVRSSQKPGKSWTVFQLFLPYQGLAS
jgi:PAS domain S-box-containing protein